MKGNWFSLGLFVFVALACPTAKAAGTTDRLVYSDGDAVLGTLVSNDGITIVFHSLRFGMLSVPASEAKVIPDHGEPAIAKTEPIQRIGKTKDAKELGWHGRIAVSSAFVNDTDKRRNQVVEASLERKWLKDELKLAASYEFDSSNDTTNTDLLKASSYWRHDISQRIFSLYNPSLELNRHYFYLGKSANYLLFQQEAGAGYLISNTDRLVLRAGLSGITYHAWSLSGIGNFSKGLPAAFVETQLKLTKNIAFVQRGIWFYPLSFSKEGWQSLSEFNRKLTETLSLSLSHEIRKKSPDIRVQDYNSWRLKLGFDY